MAIATCRWREREPSAGSGSVPPPDSAAEGSVAVRIRRAGYLVSGGARERRPTCPPTRPSRVRRGPAEGWSVRDAAKQERKPNTPTAWIVRSGLALDHCRGRTDGRTLCKRCSARWRKLLAGKRRHVKLGGTTRCRAVWAGCARPNIRCMRPVASGSRPCACVSLLGYVGVELRDVRGSCTGLPDRSVGAFDAARDFDRLLSAGRLAAPGLQSTPY